MAMNFLRGFVRKNKAGVSQGPTDHESQAIQKERSLCVQHLRKLYLEFLHPPARLTKEQEELKQYLMLPLFLKAFSGTDPMKISEKFGDAFQFAGHMSKLMVSEIQRRAADKTKSHASKDILMFLFHHEDEIDNKGWNLINTLLYLTNSELAVVENMVAASLPSTLVKCIKLFFSLPENVCGHDKCLEIQRVLVPILVKLCNHPITAKQLIRTDDLASLFKILTIDCSSDHTIWRSGVSEVITSITRHCFTNEVVDYIYEKSCIKFCLANIESHCQNDPLGVVEMFVTLTCVLKDSADASPILLDSFKECQGYKFLEFTLLSFSQRSDDQAQEACRNLVLLVASLVMTGYTAIIPSMAISTPFHESDYIIPKPSNSQGVSIRNLDAFKVLMDVFLKANNEILCLSIINSIQSLLNYDNANYFIIEPTHPFAQFIQKIPYKTPSVRNAILELIKFVALHLSWVPSQELVAMTILFKNPGYRDSQCAVLKTLILLINHNVKYKSILRQAGLIDVMVMALQQYSNSILDNYSILENEVEEDGEYGEGDGKDYIFLLMECLRLLIENNQTNANLFRQNNGSKCALNLIPYGQARPFALKIIEQLIVDGGHDDLGILLGLMHSTPVTDIKLKSDVLASLIRIFDINAQTRSVFQEVGGFVYVVSILVSLEGSLAEPPVALWAQCPCDDILDLVWKTFYVLTSAMKDELVNKVIFMDEIRFKGLIDTVKLLGCFSSKYEKLPPYKPEIVKGKPVPQTRLSSVIDVDTPMVDKNSQKYFQMVICKIILSMATSNFDTWQVNFREPHIVSISRKIPRIFHPTAVNGLVEILPMLCDEKEKDKKKGYSDVLLYAVYEVQYLMGSEINQQLMCDAGMPYLLLNKCQETFINEHHPLNAPLTKLFERLAGQSLHPKVLRAFCRLGSPLCSNSPYAVLRLSSEHQKKDIDVVDNPHDSKISLKILNGDIELNATRSDSPELHEENEFQTEETDNSSAKSIEIKSDNANLDSNLDETDGNVPYDENTPTSPKVQVPPKLQQKADEKPPLRKKLSSMSLTDSLTSSYSAIIKIESMLDDECDEELNGHSDDLKEEIMRLCDRFEGRPLPQNLVKSVVSLTTPRNDSSKSPLEPPPFVEFSMVEDGYACLFVPSLTPQAVPISNTYSYRTSATVAAASLSLAATSASERTFPPQTGLTYSGWIYMEMLPTVPSNLSSIGLLTLEKQYEELNTKRIVNSSILQIYLSLQSQSVVVNCDDRYINDKASSKGNAILKLETEDLFRLHRWNHICVVLNKSMMRHNTASIYINGRLVATSKMKYIHQGIPNGADSSTFKIISFIGTHPRHCHLADLVWRQGPMVLFEEPLAEDGVKLIYNLGPSYTGCFQAPCISDEDETQQIKADSLILEDKILLCLNPHNVTLTTLLKLSSQCVKSDLDILATELNMSQEDKYTPIRLLPNSALHMNGLSRPIGFFFVGDGGLRLFCPNPVASAFVSVGGMSILLCLVAMVSELGELYASLKALTCILQSSQLARREMERVEGYQILAFLLKKKKHLLNTHILHLAFSLVGTVSSEREYATIPRIKPFTDLICDLELWHNAPSDLERSLFKHFYELITQGPDQQKNIQCLRKLGCISRLIHVVQDGDISDETLNNVANILSVLLRQTNQNSDLIQFGQYLASTLPTTTSEQNIKLDTTYDNGTESKKRQTTINQRNALLDVIIHLLLETSENGGINLQFSEQLYRSLGFDWLLLFFGAKIHKTTVIRGVRMLCRILSDVTALHKFQNGDANGHWLEGSEALTSKKQSVAAGFNVPENMVDSNKSEHEVNHKSYKQKGMPLLTFLLEEHTDIIEIYFLLFSLLLKPINGGLGTGMQMNIESLHLMFWPPATAEKIRELKLVQVYCLDSIGVLLHMVRKLMSVSCTYRSQDHYTVKVPETIIQFIEFLYQNVPEIYNYSTSPEFLSSLVATLFPVEEDKELMEFNIEVLNNEVDGGIPADKSRLTDHPSKKFVVSFITTIIVDTMQLTTGKIGSFTDLVFNSYPSSASNQLQNRYQTEIITSVIREFTSGKTWTTMNFTASDSNFMKFCINGVVFAGKVVDKMWMGCYLESYKEVLKFLSHLINHLGGSTYSLDQVYHSLNRVLLYQISKPTSRLTDQTNVLELLHYLTANSKTVFSSNNNDEDFITGLTHWLLVVGLQDNARKESRKLSLSDIDKETANTDEEKSNDNDLYKLITAASERVWNVFYLHKKEIIEQVFGIQSTFVVYQPVPIATPGRTANLDLKKAKELLCDHAAKGWITFIGNEEKRKNEFLSTPLHKQSGKKLPSKLVMSLKREKTPEENFTIQETLDWITVHLKAVKALIHMKQAKHSQEILIRNHSAEKNWSNMELELISEGGIWGPEKVNGLEKWMLDDVEGPSRMRKKLSKNDMFYTHYPYIEQEKEQLLTKHRLAFSHDSRILFQLCQKYTNPDALPLTVPTKANPFSWRPKLFSLDGFEAEDSMEEVNTQTIIQLLETGEKIFSMYRCARVRGLDSAEGLFLFGRNHLYVVDGFTLMSAESSKGAVKEIKDIYTLPEGSHEPLIPAAKGNSILKRSFFKWEFEVIKEVHKRRYLLQDIAIEVFSNDGSNHLLVFPQKSARDKVYDRINRVSPALISSQESVAGMSSDTDVEGGAGLFTTLLSGERSVTQKWVRGEISNFQYLMFLNTLAGRSYNDLMQYPIFPWVLRDYTSQFLDLTNEKTFRDFSKPMGAQGASRLENYRKRFREWEDPLEKTPAYYYGTHYSSAMIVASYMIRLEPFTQHFLRLQGGHFDLPDRLFHSIKDAWLSASESNMADIKELIPEFFYLPDFLLNGNKFDLGTKQNGEDLGDVILPPWAKGDSIEFIRLHREALECDYVSSHIHEWIDLVFGYKQQGQAAIEADNVFHYWFYEKSVDLDQIDDPMERKAAIGFINNFGQMPKQLFKKPHPCKRVMKSQDSNILQTGTLPSTHQLTYSDKLFFHHLSNLVPSVQPVKELKNAVGQILPSEKSWTAATEANKAIFPGSLNRIGWGYGDFSLRYFSSDEKLLAVFEDVFTGQVLCAACLNNKQFITGGTSSAVCVWEVQQNTKDKNYNLKLIKVLYGHQGDVTSLIVSKAYNMIVTGSEDKSCIIWDLRKFTYTRRLNIPSGGPVTCITVNNTCGDIITCAGTHLYVWTVNGQLLVQENTSPAITGHIHCCAVSEFNEWDDQNVIITGSADGLVKMWGIQFHDTAELEPRLRQVSLNRSLSKSMNSIYSKDYLLVDCPDFKNRVWKRKLALRHKLTRHTAYSRPDNIEPASITALAITKDHRKIFVGDSRGRIYSWSLSAGSDNILDHWVKDEVADVCSNCCIKFTFAERKHHCRNCGNVFCGRCSRYESPVVHLKIFKAVRVCGGCYTELKRKPSFSTKLSVKR